jgi:hypothetical protein
MPVPSVIKGNLSASFREISLELSRVSLLTFAIHVNLSLSVFPSLSFASIIEEQSHLKRGVLPVEFTRT